MSGKGFWDIDEEVLGDNHFLCQKEEQSFPKYSESKFADLHSSLLKGINLANIYAPNHLQDSFSSKFPKCEDNDVIVYAPKKSGKTSAIIITLLNSLLKKKQIYFPSAVMLYPSYELAEKAYLTGQNFIKFCKWPDELKLRFITKGETLKKVEKITENILIGTPGKVVEILQSCVQSLEMIKFLVVEEADVMINEKSYYVNICRILELLQGKTFKSRCHRIVSSSSKEKNLSEFLKHHCLLHAVVIEVPLISSVENFIDQYFLVCSDIEQKIKTLLYIEDKSTYPGQTVIFCNTKEKIVHVKKMLHDRNFSAAVLCGGKRGLKFSERKHILEEFEQRKFNVLLTTRAFMDVISFESVSKLINWDDLSRILEKTYYLDIKDYKSREELLKRREKSLIINFIEKETAEFVLKDKIEIDGKEFCDGKEIITYEQIKNYF